MNLADLRASEAAILGMADVAELLGVDERTVRRACDDGQLPCISVGRRRLIPREPLLALLTTPSDNAIGPGSTPGPNVTDDTMEGHIHEKSQRACGTPPQLRNVAS